MIKRPDRRSQRLLVSSKSFRKLEQQNNDQTRSNFPISWEQVIDHVSRMWCGQRAGRVYLNRLLRRQYLYISWQPNFSSLYALLNNNLIYVCWGFPRADNIVVTQLKRARINVILKHARRVITHDESTAKEIYEKVGQKATIIPYPVDANFFSFSPPEKRTRNVIIPGNNDRDEELVKKLVAMGSKVIRVFQDKRVSLQYSIVDNVKMLRNVPYTELRSLYQTASVVAIPTKTDVHEAGQTSILEAIACGAPVVISKGRTSSMFYDIETVREVVGDNAREWHDAITLAADCYTRDQLQTAARYIHDMHSPKAVERHLLKAVEEANAYFVD